MPKQILIVDDDRELSRMLHATLERVDSTYRIVEVPSAEEAMLETRRNAFDLLVCDVRLPGLDGLEMLRRLRKQRPETQAIVISGRANPIRPDEVQDLNPVAVLSKPINTEAFITAVQKVLGGSARPVLRSDSAPVYSPSLSDRLTVLRRDLGCLAVYLGDLHGNVVARAGDVSAFNVEELLHSIEVAFSASLKVSGLLGGVVSQNMHFFDGDDYDVYVLNVGQTYMLVMLYPGDIGARQMGQVSRYGRLAADDMLNSLADSLPAEAGVSPFAQPALPPQNKTKPLAPIVVPTFEITSPDLPEPIVLIPAADLVLEPQPQPEPEPVQVLDINFDTLGTSAPALAATDLDSFWDDALTGSPQANNSKGNEISFEDAMKLGLVSNDEKKAEPKK
jgi:CheY-like chemotaxis protein